MCLRRRHGGPARRVAGHRRVPLYRLTASHWPPFGVGAYYPAGAVNCVGAVTEFARPTEAGGGFRTSFCSVCGTSLYWRTSFKPDMIGTAIGAIGDPAYPAPLSSLWERSRHTWIAVGTAAEHLPRGWGKYPSGVE